MDARLSAWSLFCMLMFHSPDGLQLLLESGAISAVRPVEKQSQVTPGTNSVVYIGSRPFGVVEDLREVQRRIDGCKP